MKTWLSALTLALLTFAIPAAPVWALGAALKAASDTSFSRPHDLVLSPDAASLYASDAGNDAVQVLDPMTLRTLGTIGPDELDSPHDVVFDARGRLLVADTGNDRIQILAADLNVLRSLGGVGYDFNEPRYVAFDGQGRLYVADEYNDAVKIFDAQYRLLLTLGTAGNAPLNRPEGVAVRGDTLWVSDTHNDRILRYRLR